MSRERAPPVGSGRYGGSTDLHDGPAALLNYGGPPVRTTAGLAGGLTVTDRIPSVPGNSMPSPLQPLPDQSLADAVADHLRAAIHQGEYSPGDRLVERTLSTRLGVSHIPVREALTKLEDEGLVVRLPRRGARVAQLSAVTLTEISSMRVLLEGFVVRRVTERWTPRVERDLLRLSDRMVAAARRGDAAAVLELDHRFHERLWQQADHSILIEVATTMRGRINGFLRATIQTLSPDELVAHAVTHRILTEVIAAGDPDAAADAMRAHIQAARDRIEDRPTGSR
jgi:DNA-binding GntR family transcriptional regulator